MNEALRIVVIAPDLAITDPITKMTAAPRTVIPIKQLA